MSLLLYRLIAKLLKWLQRVSHQCNSSVRAPQHVHSNTVLHEAEVHSKHIQMHISLTLTFEPLSVKSEVITLRNANKAIVREINVPSRPQQAGPWIFQKELTL